MKTILARYILGCPPINPCLYNGKCVDKPFGFSCVCPKAYFGNRCQFKKRRKTTAKPTTTTTTIMNSSTTLSRNQTQPESSTLGTLGVGTSGGGFNLLLGSTPDPNLHRGNSILGSSSCNYGEYQ